jgi:HAD superfamily hydrolase (TIGR01509 family)
VISTRAFYRQSREVWSVGLAISRATGQLCAVLPAALLLDLDGTLVDSEAFHAEGIARYMAGCGHILTDEEKFFVIGHAWQEIYEHLRVQERVGISLPDLQALSIEAKEQLEAEGHPGLEVLEGARELVALARSLEIPVCIVSGSSRAEIEHALVALGFGESLEFYYGSEDYEHGKPAPDGYLRAASTLGVDPARCLVFEDSQAGIASALAASMRVVATRAATPPAGEAGHQDQSDAHMQIDDLVGIDAALLESAMS